MSKKRRPHSSALKAQARLEAPKNIKPVHAIATTHKVHPMQVNHWKIGVAFSARAGRTEGDPEADGAGV
jgi:transposase-like protein